MNLILKPMKTILSWIVGGALSLASIPVSADYVAYSVGEIDRKPLPRNLDLVSPESLINVDWGDYRGPRTRIGVLPVENDSNQQTLQIQGLSGQVTYDLSTGGIPVQGIEAIIIDIMSSTGRFRLLERTVLDQALSEQDLGTSGRLSAPSAAKIGKVLGAQYLLQAVITNYEQGVEQKSSALGGLISGTIGGTAGSLLAGLGVSKSKGIIGMNMRLIDAETSEIVFSNQIEVDLSESRVTFGGGLGTSNVGLGGFISDYSKTPIGQAVIAAANKGVYELVKQIGAQAPRGSVIKVSSGKVYINLGAGVVDEGDVLNVLKKGEELIDPDTGISLGSEDEELGTLNVQTVKEKFSIATEGTANAADVSRGDVVESSRGTPDLVFAENWTEPERKKPKREDGGENDSPGNFNSDK